MNITPYKTESLSVLYNTLFCDMPELYHANTAQPAAYPWNVLQPGNYDEKALLDMMADDSLESRIKLLACRKLAANGYSMERRELLGVIIEVGLEGGLDVVAAFKDGTARYINQAEKLIVWEAKEDESARLVDDLFAASSNVVSKIGPWNDERLPPPPEGSVRLNFLVSDGLYFGQGPFDVLAKDAMGGPVIQAAMQLLMFLTGRVPA